MVKASGFWKDRSCGGTELRRVFPNNIAVDKEVLVCSNLVISGGIVAWNPIFRRALQDWKLRGNWPFIRIVVCPDS